MLHHFGLLGVTGSKYDTSSEATSTVHLCSSRPKRLPCFQKRGLFSTLCCLKSCRILSVCYFSSHVTKLPPKACFKRIHGNWHANFGERSRNYKHLPVIALPLWLGSPPVDQKMLQQPINANSCSRNRVTALDKIIVNIIHPSDQ